jgi:hypothetical protein
MNRDEGPPRGNRPRGGNWRSRKEPQNQEHQHGHQPQGQNQYVPRTSQQSQDGSQATGSQNRRRNNRQFGSGRIQIPSDLGDAELLNNYNTNPQQQPQYQHPPPYQQPQQHFNRERGRVNRGVRNSNQNTAIASSQQRDVQRDDRQASSSRNTRHQDSDNTEKKVQSKPFDPLCYSNLLKLVNSQNNIDIVHVLANGQNGFQQFIQEKLRPDLFILMMKALKKVCESELDESKLNILNQACSEPAFPGKNAT